MADEVDLGVDRAVRLDLDEEGAASGGESSDPGCADRGGGRSGERGAHGKGALCGCRDRRRGSQGLRCRCGNGCSGHEGCLDPLPAPVDRGASSAADEQRLVYMRFHRAELGDGALAVRVCPAAVGISRAGEDLVQGMCAASSAGRAVTGFMATVGIEAPDADRGRRSGSGGTDKGSGAHGQQTRADEASTCQRCGKRLSVEGAAAWVRRPLLSRCPETALVHWRAETAPVRTRGASRLVRLDRRAAASTTERRFRDPHRASRGCGYAL